MLTRNDTGNVIVIIAKKKKVSIRSSLTFLMKVGIGNVTGNVKEFDLQLTLPVLLQIKTKGEEMSA